MSHQPIPKIVGDSIGILGEFRNSAGTLTDPASVTAWCIRPDQVRVELTAARPTDSPYNVTGFYCAYTDTDTEGRWRLYIKGNDTFDRVQMLEFTVSDDD